MKFRIELPDELAGWVHDAARRFNVEPSVIVHRALEHYLRHMAQVREASKAQHEQHRSSGFGICGSQIRKKEDCPYSECLYQDGCPGEICAL